MFGTLNPRMTERSRSQPYADISEYARLEFPHEDPRTVVAITLASRTAAANPPRRRFRLFRVRAPSGGATAGNL